MEAIIGPLGLLFLGLILGYFRGVEKERNRICEAFQHEREYSYSDFNNVLEKHEERKAGWKAKEKFNKRRKKHNKNK